MAKPIVEPRPSWPWLLAGLAVLACTLRLIHVRALSNTPVFAVLLGDSKRYVEWAAEIAGGNWLGSGVFYQAPLYPYVLAGIFKTPRAIQVSRRACRDVVRGSGQSRHGVPYDQGLSLSAAKPQETVELQVRLASLDVLEGRIAEALLRLENAAATARSSGQTAVANDVEATIQALRRR